MATRLRAGATPRERFEIKYEVDEETGCWLWIGYVMPNGYSRFYAGKEDGRGVMYGHIWSYTEFVGPIPAGYFIDHVLSRGCGNKHCVNPAHLEAVTNQENLLRAPWTIPGRFAARTHCNHGHEFTEASTAWLKDTNDKSYRRCKTCLDKWYEDNRVRRNKAERERRARQRAS